MNKTNNELFNFICGSFGLITVGNRAFNPGMVRRAEMLNGVLALHLLNEADPMILSVAEVKEIESFLVTVAEKQRLQQEAAQNAQLAAMIQQGIITPSPGKKGRN